MKQVETHNRIVACILAHNPADGFEIALKCLEEQSRPPDAVVVVDNGSQPPIDDVNLPASWTLLRLEANAGVGAGHNTALRWAALHGYRLAWLLEHDDFPLRDCLRNLDRHVKDLDDRAPSWVVVYPKNLRSFAEAEHIGTGTEPPDEAFAQLVSGMPTDGLTLVRAMRFTFNGPLVKVREVLEAGGVREDLFVGHEDWELSDRLVRMGAGLYYARDSFVVHLNKARRSAGEVDPIRLYYSARNQARLKVERGHSKILVLLRAGASSGAWVAKGLPRHAKLRLLAGFDACRGRMGRLELVASKDNRGSAHRSSG